MAEREHESWCALPADHEEPCSWSGSNPPVVVIRDSAGVPVYAIETQSDEPARPSDGEKRRVVEDLLRFRLLPDAVRDYLTGYLAALED